ncbi:FG-GAP repeat domain-containing protein [Rhodopirellula baltica]
MHPASDLLTRPCLTVLLTILALPQCLAGELWSRHTIDDSLVGADGVRLADFDGDGLQDIVTGWEESGVIRLYLNPGPKNAKKPWSQVTVGLGKSVEDAVAFDVNGDGLLDVISCHEGKSKRVLVHQFDSTDPSTKELLKSENWRTSIVPKLSGQRWMFAAPVSLRGGSQAIVFGSKERNASLTIMIPPASGSSDINTWSVRKLRDCGWIMSIQPMDMDGDGDTDIVFSDRRSKHRGVAWLEQPNSAPGEAEWHEHTIGATKTDALFIDARPERVLVTTRRSQFLDLRKNSEGSWVAEKHANPVDVPFGKAIRVLSDGSIVLTANTHADSAPTKQPAVWKLNLESGWQPICSVDESKFDRIELIDLDGDGDLDLLTCEERQLLGVVWYENPEID